MKILDKYIIKRILSTFFFVVLILVAIIGVIDVTEKIDKFARNNLGGSAMLAYYVDFIPWIAGLITPITAFIAIVYVTSRMAAHTEIIAILSSGVSFKRLLFPYFLASAIIAVISFVLNGWIIPQSNRDRLNFEMQYFQNRYFYDHRNVHMQVDPNVYLFLGNYNNQTNVGYQFSLERFDSSSRLVEKLTAENIQWDSVKGKWTLNMWKLKRVDELFQSVGNTTAATKGERMDTTLAITPNDFANENRKFDGMTINELSDHIAKMKFRGSTGVQVYEVEKYIRFATPFTIFVLAFMGMIVSSRKSRGGTGFQIALGFFLSFIFILFFTTTRTFAEAGSMAPMLAAWLPNISFGIISLFMYKYVPR
jgi:Predicted permeases